MSNNILLSTLLILRWLKWKVKDVFIMKLKIGNLSIKFRITNMI